MKIMAANRKIFGEYIGKAEELGVTGDVNMKILVGVLLKQADAIEEQNRLIAGMLDRIQKS